MLTKLGLHQIPAPLNKNYNMKKIDLLGNAHDIILGCTEIPLLIRQEDVLITVFNTTHIHVQAAVKSALA